MAGFRSGNGAAKSLIRLRVILSGEGVVREDRGSFRATLPGDGHLVDIDDRAGTSQMLHPSGSPLGEKMDLGNEAHFAIFMHMVDSCMSAKGRIPTYLLTLADEYARACAEGDQVLASIVSESNIELPVPEFAWSPGPAFRGLSEAARWSVDHHLSDAAEDAARLAHGGQQSPARFDEASSQCKWLELIERWASADAATFDAGDSTWTEIKTRSGLVAASRRVGHDLATILTGEDGERLAFGKVSAYALHDEFMELTAVAVADDGKLTVHLAQGAAPVDEEADALRRQVCPDAAGPRGP
jgi:hypothetical protein